MSNKIKMKLVYLDNNSATRIDPRVFEAMVPFLQDEYGNAQCLHSLGQRAHDALEGARAQVARLINAQPVEIIFTSCGSESNNLALKGVPCAYREKGNHTLVSNIEHFSVLQAAKRLAQEGFEITYLPVDKYGLINPDDLRAKLRNDTILVSIQHANPEIGTIQPIKELAAIAHQTQALFHTDAVASAGMTPVDVNDLDVDLLSFAGVTMYSLKGSGALYLKKDTRIIPLIDDGFQESGRRAGTENIPAIVGFGKAYALAVEEMAVNQALMFRLQQRLIQELPLKL